MPKFELFIPKSEKLPMDLRLRLEAENWIEALRAGLAKVGIGGLQTESILCDIKEDNSIHVTDTRTGRVFRILELSSEAPAATPSPQPTPQPAPAPTAAPSAPTAARPGSARFTSQPTIPQMSAVKRPDEVRAKAEAQAPGLGIEPAAPAEPPKAATAQPAAPRPAAAPKPAAPKPATPKPAAKKTAAPEAAAPAAPPAERASTPSTSQVIGRSIVLTSEATADMLEEVFAITGTLDSSDDKRRAIYRMLDLAMEKVGTDAGTVFAADINKSELEFTAVRGPKAKEVARFKIQMGQGIVGFCCQENLGLAVSDAPRDPRFHREISERIGYPTRSILCVPLRVDERVVGALELINKRGSDQFSERDLGLANFIAQHLARCLEPS
jgi:hypothetical protein